MQSKLFRITLNTTQPDVLLRFYKVLGFQFSVKIVEKGSRSWLGLLKDFELEIFGIQESFSDKNPGVQLSFQIANMQEVLKGFRGVGAQIMVEPMPTKSGIVAIVIDPDGRSVELLEK